MITRVRGGMNVKRFHTTHRIKEETNGHHTANVCAILLRLNPDCSRNLLVAALMHDVPEAYTGDIPAPYKWDNPHIQEGLRMAEYDYILDHELPRPILTEEEVQLLKVADMLDLVLSSLEELGRGNRYARELIQNGQDYLASMKLDEELLNSVTTLVGEVKSQWMPTMTK